MVNEKQQKPNIRLATIEDAEAILSLFEPFIEKGIVLRRSIEEIREKIFDFIVAVIDDDLVGCVSIYNYGNDLREVRSLIVRKEYQGLRCGSAMLQKAIEIAQEKGTSRLFALTLRENFFLNNGFKIVSRHAFPEKVWKDCSICPKRDCCDEVAVMIEFPAIKRG